MTSKKSTNPSKTGLSLYANLLDPSTNASTQGTISRAPVVLQHIARDDLHQEEASASKQQLSSAALRFQPTKRPQLSGQKPKVKPTSLKADFQPPPSAKVSEIAISDDSNSASRPQGKNTLADWTAEPQWEEAGNFYNVEKRQRGGRKKRKKNLEDLHVLQNWDDIYDPSRPNNYEEYKHSDEKILELRQWKDKLYAHRMARRSNSDGDSVGGIPSYLGNDEFNPSKLSFAPPLEYNQKYLPKPNLVPQVAEAEATYARHVVLSKSINQAEGAFSSFGLEQSRPSSGLPRPIFSPPSHNDSCNNPQGSAPASSRPSLASIPASIITKAPVWYDFPPTPSEDLKSDAELASTEYEECGAESVSDHAPRSLRPGQKGFAERLMSKYGWTKGSGLGASGSGIVKPLHVQVEKHKKKSDSEAGGFVGRGGKGKILGGSKKGGPGESADTGKFGSMSEVVVLLGMVDGMDLDAELQGASDGGLMQEIGEECGEKYGRVERVYIDRSSSHKTPVFVKFTSQLSALRAVNALEGRIFNGNKITARFFDTDTFEKGIYG